MTPGGDSCIAPVFELWRKTAFPFRFQGIEAYKKTWEVFFAWFQDSGVFDISELNITAGDDGGVRAGWR